MVRCVDKGVAFFELIIEETTALFRDREMSRQREMKTTYFANARTLLLKLFVVTDTKEPFYLGWFQSAEIT